ncbi:nucleolar protein 12-like, partial [Microcaecilia unicolor]|uniref:Nucleolar protein 12 n=1 Tax=Microcaecilia unicolor TaxID=1415580 RepID=A0A6P7X4J9_9AMPH
MGKRKARGGGFRRVLTFDEEKRREYLTGFHKRKVERRKVAVQELKKKIKEEQRKMREERHKEYMRMLKERQEALEEADELEQLVTSQTESLQYDHPNHTVTVTTISDLDLSGVGLLGLGVTEQVKVVNITCVTRVGTPLSYLRMMELLTKTVTA